MVSTNKSVAAFKIISSQWIHNLSGVVFSNFSWSVTLGNGKNKHSNTRSNCKNNNSVRTSSWTSFVTKISAILSDHVRHSHKLLVSQCVETPTKSLARFKIRLSLITLHTVDANSWQHLPVRLDTFLPPLRHQKYASSVDAVCLCSPVPSILAKFHVGLSTHLPIFTTFSNRYIRARLYYRTRNGTASDDVAPTCKALQVPRKHSLLLKTSAGVNHRITILYSPVHVAQKVQIRPASLSSAPHTCKAPKHMNLSGTLYAYTNTWITR